MATVWQQLVQLETVARGTELAPEECSEPRLHCVSPLVLRVTFHEEL